jgi:hypothetical protein
MTDEALDYGHAVAPEVRERVAELRGPSPQRGA